MKKTRQSNRPKQRELALRPAEGDPLYTLQQQAEALAASLGKLRELSSKNRTADVKAAFVRLAEDIEQISSWKERLREVEASLSGRAERDFLEIEARLREACASRKWNLGGQWPKFYVERGVPVEFEEGPRRVTVSDRAIEGAGVEAIIAALEPLVRDLIPRGFSARKFGESLADAYDDLRKNGPTQLPVLAIYRQLVLRQQRPRFWKDARSEDFIGLSIDQFRARLSRALEGGAFNIRGGRELRLLPPLDPKDSVFVYQPAEQRFGYIGRIEFIERISEKSVP